MPIPITHMKERLSVAYVRAVTARAGAQFTETEHPEYGNDAFINEVRELPNGRLAPGFLFHCQIKSTTDWEVRQDLIVYDMEADAYNKLVQWEGGPCILVLYKLPKNDAEWLFNDEDCLHLRNCCYWEHLVGNPKTNTSTVRITIPRRHLFDSVAVNDLLQTIRANQGRLV